jgi:outer membrane protein assembly factor BamB
LNANNIQLRNKRSNTRLRIRRRLVPVIASACLILPTVPARALNERPDRTWGTNGPVNAALVTRTRVYIGGDFSRVISPGGRRFVRTNLAAFSRGTGRLLRRWHPNVKKGPVYELAATRRRIFVGGAFNRINRRRRKGLAALSARRGRVVRRWRVNANFPVWELARKGEKLYVGGAFTKLRGRGRAFRRRHLGLVNTKTGRISRGWHPATDGTVKALDISPTSRRLYVGGNFRNPRRWIVALVRRSGTVDATWRGHDSLADMSPCGLGCILDIASRSDLVYAAVGGASGGNRLVALTAATGNLAWQRIGNGDVHTIDVAGRRVYAGGHFNIIANRRRRKFVTVRAGSGTVLSDFTPGFNSTLGVFDIAGGNRRLYMVGRFTEASGLKRLRVTRFSS